MKRINLAVLLAFLTVTLTVFLWPASDTWERTSLIMLVPAMGLVGWTRPWEYEEED